MDNDKYKYNQILILLIVLFDARGAKKTLVNNKHITFWHLNL